MSLAPDTEPNRQARLHVALIEPEIPPNTGFPQQHYPHPPDQCYRYQRMRSFSRVYALALCLRLSMSVATTSIISQASSPKTPRAGFEVPSDFEMVVVGVDLNP